MELDPDRRPALVGIELLAVPDALRLVVAALEHSRTPCCITDAELDRPGPTIIYANPAYCAMVGRPASDVIGRTPRMMQGPMTDRSELDRLRRSLTAGELFRGETVNYRQDGTPFIISWDVIPVTDADGTPHWFVASQEDVTERRQAEVLIDAQRALSAESGLLVASDPLLFEAAQRWCSVLRAEARRFSPGCDVGVMLEVSGAEGDHVLRDGAVVVAAERLDALVAHGDSAAIHTERGPVFIATIPVGSGARGAIVWHSLTADSFALLNQRYALQLAQFAGALFDQLLTALSGTARDVGSASADPLAVAFRAFAARPSPVLRNILVEAHLPLAERLAQKFAETDDAISIASLELIRCVERFDPARGVPFAAFAVAAIQAELRHAREAQRWPVHVPRSSRRELSQVLRAEDELTVALGRTPQDVEVAQHANLALDRVRAARVLSEAAHTTTLDAAGEIADAAADAALLRGALAALDDTERALAVLRFDDGLTQQEIAKLLGISQARVSRTLQRIAEKLLAHLDLQS